MDSASHAAFAFYRAAPQASSLISRPIDVASVSRPVLRSPWHGYQSCQRFVLALCVVGWASTSLQLRSPRSRKVRKGKLSSRCAAGVTSVSGEKAAGRTTTAASFRWKVAPSGFRGDPSFSPSEVATIIGLNPYEKAVEGLIRSWSRYDRISLRRWERSTGGITMPEISYFRHADSQVKAAVKAATTENAAGVLPETARRKIAAAVASSTTCSDAPVKVQRQVADQAIRIASRVRGAKMECTGLDTYQQASDCEVLRSGRRLKGNFGFGLRSFRIAGEVDGWQEVQGQRWVVEHKRRQRKLFRTIPDYEQVQCQIYMELSDSPMCRLVQTLGSEVDTISLSRCHLGWACIEGRLKEVAKLLRKLADGSMFPSVTELEAIHAEVLQKAPPWPTQPAPGNCRVKKATTTKQKPAKKARRTKAKAESELTLES